MGSATGQGRRIAVVLFNLGGPDGPDSVRPFLFNLFNDPAIIGLPGLFLGAAFGLHDARDFVGRGFARRRELRGCKLRDD